MANRVNLLRPFQSKLRSLGFKLCMTEDTHRQYYKGDALVDLAVFEAGRAVGWMWNEEEQDYDEFGTVDEMVASIEELS